MTNQKKTTGIEEISEVEANIIDSTATQPDEGAIIKSIKSLEDAIKRLHTEADFAGKNFDAKSKEFGSTLNDLISKLQEATTNYSFLVEKQGEQTQASYEGLNILTLIPEKLQTRIENIAPQFAVEVEKIHSGRLEEIIAHIKQAEQELKDNIWQSQKLIEDATERSIRKIEEIQLIALESNKKQIREFLHTVKCEVEAIASNHGTKFLRNLGISLILATIAGGLTSWSVGTYFPRLVHIGRAGDITVNDSAVKILEATSPKIGESSQKTKAKNSRSE